MLLQKGVQQNDTLIPLIFSLTITGILNRRDCSFLMVYLESPKPKESLITQVGILQTRVEVRICPRALQCLTIIAAICNIACSVRSNPMAVYNLLYSVTDC